MCRKYICFVTLVMLLIPGSNASAQDFIGGNPAPKAGSWCTSTNWTTGAVPVAGTDTGIYVMPGATIGAGCVAVCQSIILGLSSGQTGGLTIDGGSLAIADFWVLGYLSGSTGKLVMYSGSAKCGRTYVGFVGGTGTWDQYGGTFETAQLWIGTDVGAKGTVNLYGGTITVQPVIYFEIRPVAQSSGLMNIAGGKLVLMGDYVSKIKRYIGEGKIVAYNGDPGAALKYDYNISSRGRTTVYAVIDPSAAHNPYPSHMGNLGLSQQNITWKAGNSADRHNLYFGSSEADLQEISHGQEPNSYPVSGLKVKSGNTYYWRVDEVRDSNGYVRTGDIWQFKAAEYTVVDDMESYNSSTKKMNYTWADGIRVGGSGSAVSIETDRNHCHYLMGQAMRFDYKNDGVPYKISEARATISTLMAGTDWSAGQVKVLTVLFLGVATNAADQLYVKLGDGTHEAIQIYSDFNDLDGAVGGPNINAIQQEWWHEWNIDLSRFANVNLNSLSTMTIGVGKQPAQTSGKGTIYFDDIRLYPKRCLLHGGLSRGDISGDCLVDFDDFAWFVEGWLDSSQ